MKTIPGGVTIDDRGRPSDANGNTLDGLPDHLSEEEVKACRTAGLVAQKQVDFYSTDQLARRFDIPVELASKAKGDQDLFENGASESDDIEATTAAEELADEAGLDLSAVEGTGKDDKVLKSDVQDAISETDE